MENRHFQIIPPIEQAAVRQLGFLVFGILLFAAAFFYQMKMVFSDPAFHTFEILSQNNIAVQANRFGAVVTQIVPLIFYRMGASLPVILIAYSCCFMLLHLLIYWLLTKYDMRAAIVVPFYYLVFSTDLFYWTISEHQQAMLYLIAWFAFLYKNKQQNIDRRFWTRQFPVHLLAFVWIIFLYPSSIITILFALGYCFFVGEKNNKTLALLITFALLVFVFKSQVFRHQYDAAKFGDIGRGIGLLFSKGILPSMTDFLKNCLFDYYLFCAFWIGNSWYFFRQQAKLKALYLFLFPLGLILLVQFINYNGADKFYIDNMYLPLGFMVAVPLIYEILADRKYARFTLVLLVLCFGGRLLHLGVRSQFYQDRLNYVAHLTEVMRSQPPPNECFITTTSEVDARKLMVTWSACYETALYSALSNPEEPRTLLVVDDFNNYQNILNIRGNFAAPWGNMDMTKNPFFINHIKFQNSEYKRLFKADF